MPDHTAIAVAQQERRELQTKVHEANQRIIELNHLIYQLQHQKETNNGN